MKQIDGNIYLCICPFLQSPRQGRNWVILREGAGMYIYDRKDGLDNKWPSVKCVAPLVMSLAKLGNVEGGDGAPPPPPSQLRLSSWQKGLFHFKA